MVARHRTNGGPSDGRFDDHVSEYLARLGQLGWELASTTTVEDGTLVMFFKRRSAARPKDKDENPPDGLTLGYL